MCDGLVEEASYAGRYACLGEDAGQGGPFASSLCKVGIDGWPVVVVCGHSATQVFKCSDSLERCAVDVDGDLLRLVFGGCG